MIVNVKPHLIHSVWVRAAMLMLTALLWGDPHIYSVDGLIYTFNGIGEYTMLKTRTGSYVLQARTAQFFGSSSQNYNASGFVAFAARETGSSVVEVSIDNSRTGMAPSYSFLMNSKLCYQPLPHMYS